MVEKKEPILIQFCNLNSGEVYEAVIMVIT